MKIPRIEFDPEVYLDSGPWWWKCLREIGPVVWIESTPPKGYLYITSRDEVLSVLHNDTAFTAGGPHRTVGTLDHRTIVGLPLGTDPDTHKRLSKILQPMFTPRAMESLQAVLQDDAATLVAGIAPKGKCDAVTDLANYFPAVGLVRLLGLPIDQAPEVVTWWRNIRGPARTNYNLLPYLEATIPVVAARTTGLIQHLVDSDLDDEEIVGVVGQLFAFAIDTVSDALASMFLTLARQPDTRSYLIGQAISPQRVRLRTPTKPGPWFSRPVCACARPPASIPGLCRGFGSAAAQIGGSVRRPPTVGPPGPWMTYPGDGSGVRSALAGATNVAPVAISTEASIRSLMATVPPPEGTSNSSLGWPPATDVVAANALKCDQYQRGADDYRDHDHSLILPSVVSDIPDCRQSASLSQSISSQAAISSRASWRACLVSMAQEYSSFRTSLRTTPRSVR